MMLMVVALLPTDALAQKPSNPAPAPAATSGPARSVVRTAALKTEAAGPSRSKSKTKPPKPKTAKKAGTRAAKTAKAKASAKPKTARAKRVTRKAPRKVKRRRKTARRRKPKSRRVGSKPGQPDEAVRRNLRGSHPSHSAGPVIESAELRAMRQLDRELFPPPAASHGAPWASSLKLPRKGPVVRRSGLPSSQRSGERKANGGSQSNPSWLTTLKMPDIPARLDPAVVRYLKFYRNTERGRRMVKVYMRRSGRYRAAIRKLLRHYRMPEDLLWLCMVESAFNAEIHSHAGAAGLWQFMPATGRIYGLTVNRRIDERLDPERATHAALKHLKDLHQRFGTWDLAFAAYNMGYGGLLASIRRFNTNDYWKLRGLEGGLPYETALYVPKIVAFAIVSRNCKVFGCEGVKRDPAAHFGSDGLDAVSVGAGISVEDIAEASGATPKRVAKLNPQLIGDRLPPLHHAKPKRKSWTVYVPRGRGDKTSKALPIVTAPRRLATHTVRWGETAHSIAAAYGTSRGDIESLNALYPRESPRPLSQVFVPAGRSPKSAEQIALVVKPRAVVPPQRFEYVGRRRVFYVPTFGDTVEEVARVTGVYPSELRRWNHLDGQAKLQAGMSLQLFIEAQAEPPGALLFEERDVAVVTVISPQFFDQLMAKRGRRRLVVTVVAGDTWRKLSHRYGLSLGQLERINHRSRRSKLRAGQEVIVYARAKRKPRRRRASAPQTVDSPRLASAPAAPRRESTVAFARFSEPPGCCPMRDAVPSSVGG